MNNIFANLLFSMRPMLWPIILLNTACVSVSAGTPLSIGLMYGAALVLLASFGFIINDVHDQVVDRSNDAGRLEHFSSNKCRIVLMFAWPLPMAALLLSSMLSFAALVATALIAIGLILYTYSLRSTLVVSNVVAAILIVSPLWLPLLDDTAVVSAMHVIVCVAAGVFALSREIALDLKDRHGDRIGGRRTIATLFGPTRAAAIAAALGLGAFAMGVSFFVATITVLDTLYMPIAFTTLVATAIMLVALIVVVERGLSRSAFYKYVVTTRWIMALYPLGLLLYA